jgi:hypothetical protein
MSIDTDFREFKPELLSRRGELIAWGSAILVGAVWLVLGWKNQAVPWTVLLLEVFLLFAGLSISFGNWMDRQTVLRMDENGVWYKNGLRNVKMDWINIRQVRVQPTRWGNKVQVIGDKAYFEFRTLGEVKIVGELKGRMGFNRGEEILNEIILNSDLQRIDKSGNGYYYARE